MVFVKDNGKIDTAAGSQKSRNHIEDELDPLDPLALPSKVGLYMCSMCNLTFGNEDLLENHVTFKHPSTSTKSNDDNFTEQVNVIADINNEQPIVSPSVLTSENIIQQKHSQPNNIPYCLSCELTFGAHLRKSWNEEFRIDFCCHNCQQFFLTQADLKWHIRSIYFEQKSVVTGHQFQNDDDLVCILCNVSFKSEGLWKSHILNNYHIEKLKEHLKNQINCVARCTCDKSCKFCKLQTATEYDFETHLRSDLHKQNSAQSRSENPQNVQTSKPDQSKTECYKCNVCNHYFDQKSFQLHMSTNHPITALRAMTQVSTPKTDFVCRICDKTFKSQNLLISHTISAHEII